MTFILVLLLMLVVLYCGAMYGYLGFRTFRYSENWEREAFHLGLCFILAIGFLLQADSANRVGYQLERMFTASP